MSMLDEIEQVLDQRVRPALLSHGGAVEVLELDGEGVLHVRLTGACSGCPAADLTNESLIEKEVTEAIPAVQRVVLVQTVSDDLMAQARAILGHRDA